MPLNSTEIDKLRLDHPHIVTPYLSIHRPTTLWSGNIVGTYEKGEKDLTVTTTSGNMSDIESGMTLYIEQGVPGSEPTRKRRVRGSNFSDTIFIDENGLQLNAGDFVWVENNFELWSKFPRIVTGATPDDVIFYKDYDIVYGGHPGVAPPVGIIDGVRCHASDTLPIDVTLSAYRSYGIEPTANVTLWTWTCDEATFLTSTTVAEPTLRFSSYYPDGVWVTLKVEDNYGTIAYTRRLIFIHSRTGANAPFTDFELSQITGDWEQGGWRSSLKIRQSLASNVLPEGAHVILWHDAVFGNYTSASDTDDYLGLQTEILNEGVVVKEEPAYTELGVLTTTVIINDIVQQLKERKMFSISLTYVSSSFGTTWYEYEALTATRALNHLYYWHSTLMGIANVMLPREENVFLKAVDDFTAGDLYSMGDQFARAYSIFAHGVSTKYGELHWEIEFNMLSDADRALVGVELSLDDVDFAGDPVVKLTRNTFPRIWVVEVSGTFFDGTTTPLIATAPGDVPDALGHKEIKLERLAFSDVNDHTIKAGRVYAVLNAEYERFIFNMSGNYTFIDLMPQRRYYVSLSAAQTGRDAWSGYIVPRNISIKFDQAKGAIQQTVEFEPEAPTHIGSDVPVPPPPPPPPPPEPVDPPDWPELPVPGYGDGFGTVYVLDSRQLMRTSDFSASSPSYSDLSPTTGANIFYDFILDPWNPYSVGHISSSNGIYRSLNLNGASTFQLILSTATVLADSGASSFDEPAKILGSPNIDQYIGFTWNDGSDVWYSYTEDSRATIPTWNHIFVAAGSSNQSGRPNNGALAIVPHLNGSESLTLYVAVSKGSPRSVDVYKSINAGATWLYVGRPVYDDGNNLAYCIHCPYDDNTDGDVVYITHYASSVVASRGVSRSEDGGATWTQVYSGDYAVATRWGVESATVDRQDMYFIIDGTFYISDDALDTYSAATGTGLSGIIRATGGFPTTSLQFYAVTDNGVFVSTDRGENWVDKTGDVGVIDVDNIGSCAIVPMWLEE